MFTTDREVPGLKKQQCSFQVDLVSYSVQATCRVGSSLVVSSQSFWQVGKHASFCFVYTGSKARIWFGRAMRFQAGTFGAVQLPRKKVVTWLDHEAFLVSSCLLLSLGDCKEVFAIIASVPLSHSNGCPSREDRMGCPYGCTLLVHTA